MRIVRLGTRGSPLALVQEKEVEEGLLNIFPKLLIHLTKIKTSGDRFSKTSIFTLGGKGIFVKEIENALLTHRIDMAVHSCKDLPTLLPSGLLLAAVLRRESVMDVLVTKDGKNVNSLPSGAIVGTGSLRRKAFLLHLRPDLKIIPIRGNVETRIKKVLQGELDAVMLAEAGVKRLGLENTGMKLIKDKECLPAPGQGAICIEARKNDTDTLAMCKRINHEPSFRAVLAERALAATLEGGCRLPLSCLCEERRGKLYLRAVVSNENGTRWLSASGSDGKAFPERLGKKVGQALLNRGAGKILAEAGKNA